MNLILIIACILALVFLILLLTWNRQRLRGKELQTKMRQAVEGKGMLKISFRNSGHLQGIADAFNTMADKQMELKKELESYLVSSKTIDQQREKIEQFENSLSQVTLLTDIGKKITSSLDLRETLDVLYSFAGSSMDVEVMELLYDEGSGLQLFALEQSEKITVSEVTEESSGALKWAMDNNKLLFLNDAMEDYGQYLYQAVRTSTGKDVGACIAIPLSLHNKVQGALAVCSLHKGVYNDYHIDFLRTLASYLSVALDNARVYRLLQDNKVEIEKEKGKTDELLLNILPAEIAEELKEKGEAAARRFNEVSILFTDFKDFTRWSEQLGPEDLVNEINDCFKVFDEICEKYNVEKIKTIGDSYMAAGGMPTADPKAVRNTIMAALEINDFILHQKKDNSKARKIPLQMRLGINTGPIVAGIVGIHKFQYDIWGDAVNTASRMESNGEVGKVNISESTYELVKDLPEFSFEYRGMIPAKGKGEVRMYFVGRNAN